MIQSTKFKEKEVEKINEKYIMLFVFPVWELGYDFVTNPAGYSKIL